jgi:hypothetical protein
MGEFVAVTALPYPEVYGSLEPMGDAEPSNALGSYKFGALSACLQAFHTFTQWSEGLHANLGTALGTIIRVIDRFAERERDPNAYAGTCRAIFFEWILEPADLAQLLLGFLVAPDGVDSYHRLPDECVAWLRFFSKQLVMRGVLSPQVHFETLLGVDETVADLPETTTWVCDSIGKGSRRSSSGRDGVL